MRKVIFPILLILWLEVVLLAFFVIQKPEFFTIAGGLWNLILTILVPAWLGLLSACIGSYPLADAGPEERIILGSALGLGVFGFAGFGFAVSGYGKPLTALIILSILTLFFLYKKRISLVWKDLVFLAGELTGSTAGIARWIPLGAETGILLAFLMGLTPPIEDFDALMYHLPLPVWWLREGVLAALRSPTSWYPHLVEGIFVFPILFGVDTATHLIHLLWLVLTGLLVWLWARQAWSNKVAWDAIAILLSMPTLLWMAGWAYTDYALTFTGMAAVHAAWKWRGNGQQKWLVISGLMAGLAMGVKYTSFIIPLVVITLILLWGKDPSRRFKGLLYFSVSAGLTASPWYIRNWIWMGNPVYPFIFGGKFWDPFLAQSFSGAGTGIGFDPVSLLLLPLTATLGTQDRNYFDGRFGPMFLILLPVAVWAAWQTRVDKKDEQRQASLAVNLLSLAGIAVWILGVISSEHLFQNRYLFPSLIPAAIPLAAGMNELTRLDGPRLRVGFIFRVMLAGVVILNLFNFGLFTILRNPLAVVTGMNPREQYLRNQQPGYAAAVELANQIPPDSMLYILFEPRCYGINARVEPDVINANFPHDLRLYGTPEKIIAAWQDRGYTHVLIRNSAENETPQLLQTEGLMLKIGETSQGDYALYQLP